MSNPWKPLTSPLLSIETLRSIQRDLNLLDSHVVHIGSGGFSIAHTQAEREHVPSLVECSVHKSLERLTGPPRDLGLWLVVNETDYWDDFDQHDAYTYLKWIKLEERFS